MGLRYSTVTGVARDDLPDGGAWLYAETVRADPRTQPGTGSSCWPRLQRNRPNCCAGLRSRPEVLAHNVETVPRIFKRIRPAFRYQRSLDVHDRGPRVRTGDQVNLILGMGETPEEVRVALRDLRDAGCDIVTITQYLRPSARIIPVERWVHPGRVRRTCRVRRGLGFRRVLAGPLVRSSYRAGRLYAQAAQGRIAVEG